MKKSIAVILGAAIAATCLPAGKGLLAQVSPELDQNWSDVQQTEWYGASQGSRLLPAAWFLALEQPGNTSLFTADDYIASFRYLPRKGSPLPVGFAVDVQDDEAFATTRLRWKGGQKPNEPWIGMNCAACHTGQIAYKGHTLRVDGGATMADFQGFIEALNSSLVETRDQPEKFARFAKRVLGPQDTPVNRDSLRAELGRLIAWQSKIETMNMTKLRYGYGRLDAFGHIFNKVALSVDAADPTSNPADAPVSYPFLWNAPQQDRVQWDGIAPNKLFPTGPSGQPFDYGALGRNTGEVIGVFAEVRPVANAGLNGFTSSVRVSSLVSMEQLVGSLRPPKWPSSFPAIRQDVAAAGRELYRTNCERCHEVFDRTDLKSSIKVKMALFKDNAIDRTDPWMACNAYLDTSASGVLAGMPKDYFRGDELAASAPLADLLATMVEGTLAGKKVELIGSLTASFFGRQPPPVAEPLPPVIMYRGQIPNADLSPRERRLQRCVTENSTVLGYKARPLNGIWATAPYLHDGSVPTLYDLLTPPEERPQAFWTGTREFDPVKVGFVTTQGQGNDRLFRTVDTTGRTIDGNSNEGHDYGSARLSSADRMAIIEYLKTL